jgi:very-short-patch-repair endonuclease
VNYISTKENIKIILNGEIYEQLPHNHLIYAPELRNKLDTKSFIDRSIEIHGSKYDYSDVIYKSDRIKVLIKCPIHSVFKQTPSVHLRGSGCPRCNDSFGEKFISKFLDKYKVEYEREYKFNDCRNIYPLRFDFYIPSFRTCIEFDGIQHYQPLPFFGGQISLDRLKINDKIKSDYCEDNYIDLIRIRYDEVDNIHEILWNNLKNRIKYGNKG